MCLIAEPFSLALNITFLYVFWIWGLKKERWHCLDCALLAVPLPQYLPFLCWWFPHGHSLSPRLPSQNLVLAWPHSGPTLGEKLGAFYSSPKGSLGAQIASWFVRQALAPPITPWPRLCGVRTHSNTWQLSSPAIISGTLYLLPLVSSEHPGFA